MLDSFLENPKDEDMGHFVPVRIRKIESAKQTTHAPIHNTDFRTRLTSRARIHNQTIRKVEPEVIPLEEVVGEEALGSDEVKEEVQVKKEGALTDVSKPSVSQTRFYVTLGLLVLVLFVGAGSSFFFYQKSKIQPAQTLTAEGKMELRIAVENIAGLAVVPQDDEPVLVLVSDPTQLTADSFFDDSQVGDQVLIYPRVGKAYLYRPSTNKIVNIVSFVPGGAEDASITQSAGVATSSVPTSL